jgi:hypothetical protein
MAAAGQLAFLLGDMPAAVDLMTRAAENSVELGERQVEATARFFLGLHQVFGGDLDKARGHLAAARAIQQEIGDLIGEGRSTAALGFSCFVGDEPDRARELIEAALALDVTAQDRWSQGQANLYLGILAEASADPQAASSYFREAIECQRPYGDPTLLPVALIGQASVMTRRDPATALQVVAAAWAVRGSVPRTRGRTARTLRARVRQDPTAILGRLRDQRARDRRRPARRWGFVKQGDRQKVASLGSHGRESRTPRADEDRLSQPDPAGNVGARAGPMKSQ